MPYKKTQFYGLWLLLTTLFAYWFSYPLDIFSRHHFFEGSDISVGLWVLNWQLSQMIAGNFDQLFTGNAFYPLDRPIYINASTFSTALLTLPVYLITKDPYICYTAAIFFSYILCSAGMLLLARSLKLGYIASLLAALIFAFSEFRHGLSGYVHLITIQWIPFVLFFIHKYFDGGRRVFLYWASLFYLIQITASAYYGIFFSIILLFFILILFNQQKKIKFRQIVLDTIPPILIVGTVAAAYFIPYLQQANEFGFKRSIAEQSVYGSPLATFFTLPNFSFFDSWNYYTQHIEGKISLSYLSIILTTVALLIFQKKESITFLSFPKLKKLAIGIIFLTPIIWVFKSFIANLGKNIYPDLVLHQQLVSTMILTPLFLLVTAFIFITKFFRRIYQGLRSENVFLLYLSISILAFIISLGPIIKLYGNQHIMINPIVTFLYYMFPGFSSIRAVSRISSLIPLGLGITAGISYALIIKRLDKLYLKKIFTFIILSALILEIYPDKGLYAPYNQPRQETPEEYSWLKKAQDGPVFEWPVSRNFLGDAVYLERSIVHQKKLVNGYAGFEWDGRKKLAELSDLSNESALLSLYAFGVRYLVVHRIGEDFPQWAGKNLGNFYQVKVFSNALVYLNKNAKTNFLPQNFIDRFSASTENINDKNRLILSFNSPGIYYVSKIKKQLRVKVNWKSDYAPSSYEWSFYPTLWRDGDHYEWALDKKSSHVIESVELAYSTSGEKSVELFREIVMN